jgi:hypothetical protein
MHAFAQHSLGWFAAVPSVSGRAQVSTNSLSALLSPKKKDATSKLAKASLISQFRDPRVATSTATGWHWNPQRCHACTRTALILATSSLGLGSPMPRLHRDLAHPRQICTDWS